MSEWQPIDTAPKDGTEVLLFIPNWNNDVKIGNWCDTVELDYGKVRRDRKYWYAGHSYGMAPDPKPTHWMPIPKSPK